MACYLAAAAAGAGASATGIPLAWILAPLVVSAVFSIAGLAPYAPVPVRRIGQSIIGASTGLYLTAPMITSVGSWAGFLVATAAVAIASGAVLSIGLARLARIDGTTAYFAMMPGGLSEMATIGSSVGAHAEMVALAHAIRVAAVVLLLPTLILTFGEPGSAPDLPAAAPLPFLTVVLIVLVGGGFAYTLSLVKLANPWMIGSLIAVSVLTSFGFLQGRMPSTILAAAQIVLGVNIGVRFRRETLRRMPRAACVMLLFVFMLGGVLLIYSYLAQVLTGIDLADAALASSPAGMVEMSITAQLLHLDLAIIIACHVMRNVMVNTLGLPLYRILVKAGWLSSPDKETCEKGRIDP
ncbi:AbrB family transcriptional regulator [Microvirga antarctica]|uniref:AbrB family transcriptional regulator n=1 Tax=Microvirga antarctica TaxID=2819233 RepID=UPI001B305903